MNWKPRRAKLVRTEPHAAVFEYFPRRALGLRIHTRRLKAAKRRA